MIYKTSLDTLAKTTTIAITILFAFIIIGQFSLIKDEGKSIPIYTTIALLSIYFGAFLFRPINYKLTDEYLIIHRPLSNIKINYKEIKSIEKLDEEKIRWTISG